MKRLIYAAVALCAGLGPTACTDLDEELYDTLTSENHTFSSAETAQTIGSVYSALSTVYWGWFGHSTSWTWGPTCGVSPRESA